MDASNYFSGAVESSSSSANDLDGSKPRHHMRPIGPLRRTDHYVALLSAYVADAASLRSPPATAVESSSAASAPEDDSSPVPEDLTYDGSYLLRFLGIESLTDTSSEGQVTDNAETNQKPISHHKDSDGHQEQFVSEDESEIHNVNVQLQDDSFKNPNDSSNQGEVAPIHHNSWSTEDWNIPTIFNNKYMDMPPQAAFAVGPRLLPPPFYSDADQYLLPISDGHQEQFVSEDGSEIHNINVQLQDDSFKNPNGNSNQGEVAPIHHNSWSTEDWNIHTIFNNKYMDMPPQAAFAVGPRLLPPPFYSDADQYLLPISDGHQEQFVSEDGSEIHNINVQLQDDSFKNPNGSSNQGEVAPIHHNSWSTEDWNIHTIFNNKYMDMPPQAAFVVGPRLLPSPFYSDADQYLLPISDGHKEQFVSEDGSEIHNINVQLQDNSFKNPNDSSNQGEVAPIHHNSWSTEDWNIHTIFNNKYMDMPPQAAFAVGPRLLPPPFYSDADQYLLPISLGIQRPSSSSEGQVAYNAETNIGTSANQKPMGHKDSDGHREQLVADDHDTRESRVESGSEINNVNVQLHNDSLKNPNNDSSNHQSEVALAPIHCNSWSTEDWNIHTIFNNKYMDMPPQAAFAVGPRLLPPPFYSDADQYLLPISDGHQEQFVSEDGSEIHNVNVQLQDDSFKNPNDSSNQGEVAPIHHNSWSNENWNIHTIFNNKYMEMPPQVAFAAGPRLLPPPPFYSDDADQYLLPSSLSPT